MSKKLQSVRGMHDLLPTETAAWQLLEAKLHQLMNAYGYQEIRMPILEKTELFSRAIGDVTDIVEKEMYTFEDRNGDSLTLRPEGTASCVRAGIQHGFLHNQIQRLWYMGTMYRHERPQKGRYREFRQLGVEVFGMPGPDIDAELIMMSARLWRLLGLQDVRLEINSLGMPEERLQYREALVAYFSGHKDLLDEDSLRRLDKNPLRILDSKNPALREVIEAAPSLTEYLSEDSKQHFDNLCERLQQAGVDYTVNPRLVRGLDYYNLTVFEWITNSLGAQGTICAGGRYDGLVAQLGGSATPAIGFAMGLERLIALLESLQEDGQSSLAQYAADIYIVSSGQAANGPAMLLAETLRNAFSTLSIVYDCGSAGMKAQLKRADKSGAELALIMGDDELNKQQVAVKPLRETASQSEVSLAELEQFIEQFFENER